MVAGSKKTKDLLKKAKNEKEKGDILNDIKITKNKKQIEQKKQAKIMAKERKDAFNELSKEEQEKIKLDMKLKRNKYEYLEDAVKNEHIRTKLLEAYKNNKIKTVDPGKRAPLTILGTGVLRKNKTSKKRRNFVLYTYSAGARITALKRLRYMRLIENKKIKQK